MTPEFLLPLIAAITAFALGTWGVWALIKRLTLDLPNDRSSHTRPTPRGGGLGVVPAILAVWLLFTPFRPWDLLVGAVALMGLSWIDDRRGLPPLTRLLMQLAAVAWFMAGQPLDLLPALGLGFVLLWFVNLYNFMDGIDGITAVETASLGTGIAVVTILSGSSPEVLIPAMALVGASLGFLVWNWHPAKVFLGDSGSVPLGLLTGGLLIILAVHGQWAAALILPAYYLADASLTLGRRLLNGEKIWQAHRKHFYQRATRGQGDPRPVVRAVLAGNGALIVCAALAASGAGWTALALATGIVTGLLGLLGWWGRNAPP